MRFSDSSSKTFLQCANVSRTTSEVANQFKSGQHFWCPTKVDKNLDVDVGWMDGVVVEGGPITNIRSQCDPKRCTRSRGLEASTCRTVTGRGCVFPFVYAGVEHCTLGSSGTCYTGTT